MGNDSTTAESRPDLGIEVIVGAASHPGRTRSSNQDSLLVLDLTRTGHEDGLEFDRVEGETEFAADGSFPLGFRGALFFVADGMGGVAGGAIASALSKECTREILTTNWVSDPSLSGERLAHHLADALRRSNGRIRRRAVEDPEIDGMGTTATAVGMYGDSLYIAHVGDSRAYLVRGGEITQITKDQSLVQHLVESGIPREEAEESSHRHVLLQALGTQPAVQVDVTHQQVREGDMLLVCSDGLTTQLRPPEIARVIGITPSPAVACQSLVSLSNERGGPDNITVVGCIFRGPGLSQPGENDEVGYRPYPVSPTGVEGNAPDSLADGSPTS